jgi:hypothetical protein
MDKVREPNKLECNVYHLYSNDSIDVVILIMMRVIVILIFKVYKLCNIIKRNSTIPNDQRLVVGKLVPSFAYRGCCVVSTKDPYGRNHSFLDLSRYFFFHVAPQLYSRG